MGHCLTNGPQLIADRDIFYLQNSFLGHGVSHLVLLDDDLLLQDLHRVQLEQEERQLREAEVRFEQNCKTDS